MITLATADTVAGVASAASQVTCTMFGMELNGTTEVYKNLYQGQLSNVAGVLYTAPASNTAFIKTITIVNNDTAARTFRLFRGGTSNANAITPTVTLLPQGMAIYEDGLGWQFYNSAGQVLQANGQGISGFESNFGVSGTLGESIERMLCPEVNSTIPSASGVLWMQAIWLTAGTTINNILWHSATTAAGTPTNYIFGLYDANRNLLAQTANQTSAAWAANTMKTVPLTSPYLVPRTGLYYIGFFMTATTIITSKGGTAKTGGQLAGKDPILQGTSSTGLTTSLPNPAAAITVSTASAWCAVT